MSEQPLVIYHRNCWDGFCAAWLVKAIMPDAEFFAANYGEAPPEVSGKTVYILDFSYPRAVLLEMGRRAQSILVLDHHASSEQELSDLPFCRFEKHKSGARMTAEYFHREDIVGKWLIAYTEDRDLWRHALPDSQIINAALRSYPLDFKVWDELGARLPESFVPEGRAIRRLEKQIILTHARNAREITMCEEKILSVNATVLFSEIAGELAKGRPFGACYFDRQDGKRQWSLRSDENGLDVSVIAKNFGGGGHKNAAGFEQTGSPASF